jgi:hypothetical protein
MGMTSFLVLGIGLVLWDLGLSDSIKLLAALYLLYSPLYFLLVFVSVPIFFAIRYLFGWRWWPSTLAAFATVTIAGALLPLLSLGESVVADILINPFGWIGVVAYGLAFWLITRQSEPLHGPNRDDTCDRPSNQ